MPDTDKTTVPSRAEEMCLDYQAACRRHNICVAPIVLLIRVPLLAPFWFLARIGEWAEVAGDFIGNKLPGFKQ